MRKSLAILGWAVLLAAWSCTDAEPGPGDTSVATDVDATRRADEGCVPACQGKTCGDDGCGGQCGTCPGTQACVDGVCEEGVVCVEGAGCDDQDPCTHGDTCQQGKCAGEAYFCDDGLACTQDICDGAGGCDQKVELGHCLINGVCRADGDLRPFMPCYECISSVSKETWSIDDSNECDDEDACTEGDFCSDGTCQSGDPLDCTVDNVCLDTWCDPEQGCRESPNTLPCDDDDACTLDDVCQFGECHGEAIACVSDDPCVATVCDAEGGCQYFSKEGACDDGNPCTVGDTCVEMVCQPGSEALACDDGNVCTTDTCDPATGCLHKANTVPCDDGNACTLGDVCLNTVCLAGPGAPDCHDDNPCTDDTCDVADGCLFVPNSDPCDDGNVCTVGDLCGGGQCNPGANPLPCDDGDPCTDDTCAPLAGCEHAFNTAPCDDGNECTAGDTCGEGACHGELKSCDDDNLCTTDSCNPFVPGGCVFKPNQLPCEDGNPCSLGDTCIDGVCEGGNGKPDCDDDNVCTSDACDPTQGCVSFPKAGGCDDNDACTVGDFCSAGTCQSGLSSLKCDDFNACTADTCDSKDGCHHAAVGGACEDGNLCTVGDACQNGTCVAGAQSKDCNDNNPCTDDHCEPDGGCVHEANSAPCDDGDSCTTGDVCDGGECVPGVAQSSCDDDDVCTTDLCDPQSGCVHLFNQASCDDDDECTVGDTCSFGLCLGAVRNCDDQSVCTKDACNPQTPGGCVYTPTDLPCDDGDPCSLGDTCAFGECQKGLGKLQCDDENICTDDVCEAYVGCTYPPAEGTCSDGYECTVGDACGGGQCQPGKDLCECLIDADCAPLEDGNLCNGTLICNNSAPSKLNWFCELDPNTVVVCDGSQNTSCKVSQCQTDTGQCVMVPINNGGSCDDGSVCTTVDKCTNGTCVGSQPLVCDDGKVCTEDYCHKVSGCQASVLADGTSCSDVDGFSCQSGECLPCIHNCVGKQCGSDGCGGTCGTCNEAWDACSNNLCVEQCPDFTGYWNVQGKRSYDGTCFGDNINAHAAFYLLSIERVGAGYVLSDLGAGGQFGPDYYAYATCEFDPVACSFTCTCGDACNQGFWAEWADTFGDDYMVTGGSKDQVIKFVGNYVQLVETEDLQGGKGACKSNLTTMAPGYQTQCDSCQQGFQNECTQGHLCVGYSDVPDITFCTAICANDGDCPNNYDCYAGFCSPGWGSAEYACYGGDVWVRDICGNYLYKDEDCGYYGYCYNGNCYYY